MNKCFTMLAIALMTIVLFSCKKDEDEAIDPDAKRITQFKIESLDYSAKINEQAKKIEIVLPAKANLSKISPRIKISAGASIEPASGQEVDLSQPLEYQVTAKNGTQQNYSVTAETVNDTAMLIIDMQNAAFSIQEYPIYNRNILCESINTVAEKARNSNIQVVFVMSETGNLLAGSQEWQLIPEIAREDEDLYAEKLSSNAFMVGNLNEILPEIGAGCIIITGVATDFCINDTFLGAKKKAYDIIVISDAHSTSDPGAQDKIDNYNNSWKNGGAWVVTSDEIAF